MHFFFLSVRQCCSCRSIVCRWVTLGIVREISYPLIVSHILAESAHICAVLSDLIGCQAESVVLPSIAPAAIVAVPTS